MNIPLSAEQQSDILWFITETLGLYQGQSYEYRQLMLDIYESLSTFTEPNTWEVLPRFKINLMHIFLRQVLPRIIAKAPRPIVSARTDAFFEWEENAEWETREAMLERNNKFSQAMQDYLTVVFNQENMKERLKYWAVGQLTYWNAFAQVVSKYKIKRSKKNTIAWQKVTEDDVDVLPTLDIISWSEMFYDPRYKMMEDMPWYFRVRTGSRLRDLHLAKDSEWKPKYFNLDKLKEISNSNFSGESNYSQLIFNITWVSWIKLSSWIDKNAIDYQIYYWFYSLSWKPEDERLYEITTVDNAIVIGMEEITEMPILDIKWHEDPEVYFSVWLCAPILWIQNEVNFQKNARATAVSKSLNRSYFVSSESWVDLSQLVWDKPWNLIYASQWVEQAMKEIVEQEDRPLDNSYFSDMNDLNRDAQRLTHTTDVTQPQWQTALTNTATGAKISFFESNSVIAELRKNFEIWVQELWYKILDWTFENIDKDLTLKRIDDWKFFRINKEAFQDSLKRYDIKIEANSSSFDDVESRRDDAIALKNIGLEAAQAGIPFDLSALFKWVLGTFENVNPEEIIQDKEIWIEPIAAPWAPWAEQPVRPWTEAAALTESVVGWNLTEWL